MTRFFPKKNEERRARQISVFPLGVFMAGEKKWNFILYQPQGNKREETEE